MDDSRIDPGHGTTRSTLRIVGPVVLLIGLGFLIVGAVDFFSAFGGRGFPERSWCIFLALPLVFVGGVLKKMGFMGRVMRYMSQEMAPPAKDTFNYMADGAKDGIKTVVGAIGEGLRESGVVGGSHPTGRCPNCNAAVSDDAKYCGQCGHGLIRSRVCPNCGEVNDPHAKFCESCRHAFQ